MTPTAPTTPTPSEKLLDLGRRVLEPYAAMPEVACAAITGSASEGRSDPYSDLDMTVYYRSLPSDESLRAARSRLSDGTLIWSMGSRGDGEFAEAFRVQGIECQIGHTSVEKWEQDMATVLEAKEVATPLHKAMSGTLTSIAVSGGELLEQWKARVRDFPEPLAVAMVKHYLKFFAVWGVVDRLLLRDSNLWIRQSLVESSFNVLGTLAGINRVYFTTFQFKLTGKFVRTLKLAPPRLYERLDGLWNLPLREATHELRGLVADTADLVEKHMPQVDTKAVRKAIARDDKPVEWLGG